MNQEESEGMTFKMEQLVLEKISEFKIPGLIVMLVSIFVHLRIVTFITSNDLERKMSSKEFRLSYSVITYLIQTFCYTLVIFMLCDLLSSLSDWYFAIIDFLWVPVFILLIISFFVFNILSNTGKKFVPSSNKWKTIGILFLFFFYLIGWLFIVAYIFATTMYRDYGLSNEFSLEFTLGFLLSIFVFTLIIPYFYRPIFKYLEVITQKNYFIEDEDNQKWFILHPINLNYSYLHISQ